mmetsp:Transcript_19614/g.27676  ORF Transcript_19614/g.27676 Transcript_19614/m.27676 type:complete len:142 (+) Transcript_19614:1-426(+)
MLETLSGLAPALETAMPSPLQNLQWLDVSFNHLTAVDPEILQFPNMKALYLHGNNLSKLGDVERLKKLPKLISLTMNGNPIQSAKIYRCFILGCLPQLKSLDHTSITEEEASGAAGWYRGHLHRQKIRKEAAEEARSMAMD